MDKDLVACNKKLRKEPELPTEKNDETVTLSDSITERLESGTVDGDRLDNYDKHWIKKLASMDELHSANNNLDIDEAQKKLQILTKYAEEGGVKQDSNSHQDEKEMAVFESNGSTLKDCFEKSRGETLKCSMNVERFIEQVDRMMYDAVRKDEQARPLSDKKLTYAERFKRNLF